LDEAPELTRTFINFVVQKTHEYVANAGAGGAPVINLDPDLILRGPQVAVAVLPQDAGVTQAFAQHLLIKLKDPDTFTMLNPSTGGGEGSNEDERAKAQEVLKLFTPWVLREFEDMHKPASPVLNEHLTELLQCDAAQTLLSQLERDKNTMRAIVALYGLGGLFADNKLIQFLIGECEDGFRTVRVVVKDKRREEDDQDSPNKALMDEDDKEKEREEEEEEEEEQGVNEVTLELYGSDTKNNYSAVTSFMRDVVPDFKSRVDSNAVRRILQTKAPDAKILGRLVRLAARNLKGSNKEKEKEAVVWMHLAAKKHILQDLQKTLEGFTLEGSSLEFVGEIIKFVEAYGK
jgi:hypothetical protein